MLYDFLFGLTTAFTVLGIGFIWILGLLQIAENLEE